MSRQEKWEHWLTHERPASAGIAAQLESLEERAISAESKLDALDKDYGALVAESNRWELAAQSQAKQNDELEQRALAAESRLDVAQKEIGRVSEVRDHWYETASQMKERALAAESRLDDLRAELHSLYGSNATRDELMASILGLYHGSRVEIPARLVARDNGDGTWSNEIVVERHDLSSELKIAFESLEKRQKP